MERIAAVVPEEPAGKLVRPDDTPWESASIPGVETRPLLGRKTVLVRMSPGSSLPRHEHSRAEQCLVLEGSIRSEEMFAQAGDFTFMPPGSTHSALYSETGCLLLIAYT
jgi:anti-sigma factor ChrR (cupin superfamily)